MDAFSLLKRFGGHVNNDGYKYMACAIELAREADSFPHRMLTKTLYVDVAKIYGKTPKNISRAIARAALDFWVYGDRKGFEGAIERTLVERPTPELLMTYLYDLLKEEDRKEKGTQSA